ncbi:peptidylprolyl isomerase [Pseudonocardia sp.]|jgi:peptidyl-prolyl cis-trans isomerase C|uniref:peptidylprolyl isomerase n=1 Tax=Pseudonocardia sp. TaxID=60912 RepID=UPI00262B7F2F|nr:peptidylprolyl isomerase [Pseudonocardia sp.]MCW2720795.1 Peptidylprolyl isomerase [Pseudonocardia sp.]MDT7617606.1 peptidyl-prolyl cis-trans isomerase [Pseudonocardiales bacterium]
MSSTKTHETATETQTGTDPKSGAPEDAVSEDAVSEDAAPEAAASEDVPEAGINAEAAVEPKPAADPVSDVDGAPRLVARIASRLRAVRPPSTRRGRIVLALVLVVVLAAGGGGFTWWLTSRLPVGVAFRAEGQDVTVTDLDHQMQTLTALYGMQKPTDPAGLDTFRRDFAKASAIGMVIDRAAANKNIAIADRAAQDFLDRYIDQYFGSGDAARTNFVTALGNVGTSETDVLSEVKRQMAASELFDAVTANVPAVTDADVDKAFTERKDSLATPQRRQLNNIVVADQATADQVVAQLKSGTAFADVAKASSQDASSKDKGGAIGTLSADQLEKPYADAAFAAAQGAVFGPVQTQYGWNVGMVTAVLPSTPAVASAVHEPLRNQLLMERRGAAWRSFLGGELADADVRYAPDYAPADPDGIPSTPSALVPSSAPH